MPALVSACCLTLLGSVTAPPAFRHVVVDDDNPPDPHCKAAGDIDGDGLPDLLAASASGGGLYWYRYPTWSKHRIATGSFTTDMAAGDVDGDGHVDVVIPSAEGLMLYRNPRCHGGDPTVDPWEAINIGTVGAKMHDVELADLDGDGRLDVVTRHQSGFGKRLGNAIHLWRQVDVQEWRYRSFPCPHGEGLAVADINGDGRPDVVIGGRWYECPVDPWTGEWTEHLYIPEAEFHANWTNGDVVVQTGDLNGDGRTDIVLSPAEGRGRLAWFAAPDWTEHVLDPALDHAHGLGVADVDGDGRLDVVVAKMHQATPPQEVRVYLNRGEQWPHVVVSTSGSHNIVLVDIGGDGRIDIFGANWNNRSSTHGALELWLNEG